MATVWPSASWALATEHCVVFAPCSRWRPRCAQQWTAPSAAPRRHSTLPLMKCNWEQQNFQKHYVAALAYQLWAEILIGVLFILGIVALALYWKWLLRTVKKLCSLYLSLPSWILVLGDIHCNMEYLFSKCQHVNRENVTMKSTRLTGE